MHAERHEIPLTTDAAGAATAYSPVITGRILTVRYVKDSFDDGVDFTLTSEATGETIWSEADVNASATRAPRQPTHSTAGVAALYAATFAVNDHIALATDRVKVVVAQGGNVKSGTIIITVG